MIKGATPTSKFDLIKSRAVYKYCLFGELVSQSQSQGCEKTKSFQYIYAQNIDCGCKLEPPRRGDSNEYQQSMFWSKNNKIGGPLQTPVFLYKVGFKEVYISRTCFPDVMY